METITSKVDHIPPELIDKILLNLPVKSLLRFSAASQLWNSIIFGPKFAQSYRGREMIVFQSYRQNDAGLFNNSPLACRLSSLLSDNPTDKATPLDFPRGSFLASCGSLWCLELKDSLLLYNPSIHTYRELSKSPKPETESYEYLSPLFYYGLGYDSVCDDYKIVTINLWMHHAFWQIDETQIYSLRNDCWRKVESPHPIIFHKFLTSKGLFLSGKIHWLINTENVWVDEYGAKHSTDYNFILSFDLSEEKFGQIELPELPQERSFTPEDLDMFVSGGKLHVCLSCVNVGKECVFSVWVMEDYELKLWTKETEFDYGHMPGLSLTSLKPFYFYDDDGNVVRAVFSLNEREKMFICKEDVGSSSSSSSTSTLVGKNFGSNGFRYVDSFTYVESLVFSNWQAWNSMKTDDDGDDDDDDADDDNNDDNDDDDDDLMMMVETLGKWRSYK